MYRENGSVEPYNIVYLCLLTLFFLSCLVVENTQHNVGICDEVMNDVAVNTLVRKEFLVQQADICT